MAMSCVDAFFPEGQLSDFRQFFEELGLFDYLTVDYFPCDNGDLGVTVSTQSGDLPGDHGLFDAPNTTDEDAAMELFLEAFRKRFPAVVCG